MPWGYPVWLFLKNNPLARWVLGIGAAFTAFQVWLGLRDQRIRKEIRVNEELRAMDTARDVINEAREKTDETIKAANDARDAIPDGPTSDSLPDPVRGILFGNHRRDRD